MTIQGPQIVITMVDKASAVSDAMTVRINRNTKLIAAQYNRLWSGMTSAFHLASRAIGKSLSFIGTAISGLFGHTFLNLIFEVTNKFATLQNVLTTFSDTAAEVRQNMDFVIGSSKELGFNILELAKGYEKFFAAGKLVGFSSEKLQETFSALSEAAVVVGLDSKRMEGVLRAVFQMMSKGKVQAEELRGQLGEALPGAFELAARAMKMTTLELDKALEQGKISIQDLLENFPAEIRKAFGPGLAGAIELPQRELERLKTDIVLIINEFRAAFQVVFTSALKTFRLLTNLPEGNAAKEFENQLISLAVHIRGIPEIWEAGIQRMSIFAAPFFRLYENVITGINTAFNAMFGDSGAEAVNFFAFLEFAAKNMPTYFESAMIKVGAILHAIFGRDAVDRLFRPLEIMIAQLWEVFTSDAKAFGKGLELVFLGIGKGILSFIDTLTTPIKGWALLASEVADFMGKTDMAKTFADFANDGSRFIKSLDPIIDKTAEEMVRLANNADLAKEQFKLLWEMLGGFDAQMLKFDELAAELDEIGRAASDAVFINEDKYQAISDQLKDQLATIREQVEAQLAAFKAINKVEGATEKAKQKASELEETWKSMSKKIEDAISGGLTDAFENFISGAKGGWKELAEAAIRQIQTIIFHELVSKKLAESIIDILDDAVAKSANIASNQSGGGGSNFFGGLGSIFSSFLGGGGLDVTAGAGIGGAGFGANTMGAFANGGSFKVGGSGGTDSQLVAFKASPNETVTVRRPDQESASNISVVNNFSINAPTGSIPRETQLQIAAKVGVEVKRAMERNR